MKKSVQALSIAFVLAFSSFTLNAYALSLPCNGYGQGYAVDSNNCPTGAVEFNALYEKYDAYALTNADNSILLTFDQGYENGYTEKILDTLKEKNAKALFFVTGDYAKKEKALIKRMIAEGHCIGNHGMKHLSMSELSEAEITEEVTSLHNYMLDEYGYEMQYLRPPCGEFTEQSLEATKNLGYSTIMWSFAYVDWKTDAQPSADDAFERITSSVHGGAIYLLHSVSSTNAQILGDVIDKFRSDGFTV